MTVMNHFDIMLGLIHIQLVYIVCCTMTICFRFTEKCDHSCRKQCIVKQRTYNFKVSNAEGIVRIYQD